MNYLIDTCVISEVIKNRPAKSVVSWLESRNEQALFLSVLTIGELEKGVQKLADGKKKETLLVWIENDLIERFKERLLPIDDMVARRWGIIQAVAEKKGKPMPIIDGLIAATAIVFECTVVTRNNPDLEASGVSLYNPWN